MSPPSSVSKRSLFVCCLRYPGFLLGLLFDPEDGATSSSEMLGDFQQTVRRHIPEETRLRNYRSDSLKF
jgi:hypothetical protein